MRSVKSVALGVVGSVLFAGGVLADDATGPDITLDLTKTIEFGLPNFSASTELDLYVGVEWPSGWGFEIGVEGGVGFGGSGWYWAYRAIGDFQFGIGGVGYLGCALPGLNCNAFGGHNVGVIYDYAGDRLTVLSRNHLWYFPDQSFESRTEVGFQATDRLLFEIDANFYSFDNWFVAATTTYDVNDMLQLAGALGVEEDGFDYLELGAEYAVPDSYRIWANLWFYSSLEFGFGAAFNVTDALELSATLRFSQSGFDEMEFGADFTPVEWLNIEARFGFTPTDWWTWVEAEIDDQIGDGPYSLVGEVSFSFNSCCTPSFYVGFGINYAIGDADEERRNPFELM